MQARACRIVIHDIALNAIVMITHRGRFRRLLLLLVVCVFTGATQLQAQDTGATPGTGALKNGEKCQTLPCTCANIPATKEGQTCSIEESLTPPGGAWSDPGRITTLWAVLAGLALLIIVVLVRRRPRPDTAEQALK